MAWAPLNPASVGPAHPLRSLDRLVACIEGLTITFAAPPWLEEMAAARREFEQGRGRVFEDEPMWEAQLSAFLEWYVLDRPLDGGARPVVRALRESPADGEGRATLRALALSFRSLFEVLEALRRETLVRDLLGGGQWRVQQDPPLPGVEAGDIFEARLVPWEGRVRFGPLFCFHPRAARASILQVLEALGGRGLGQAEVLSALAVMRLEHDRFPNMAIEHIYSLTWRGGNGARGAPEALRGCGLERR